MSEAPLLESSDLTAFREGNEDLNLAAAVADIRGRCGWHIAPVRTETLTLQAAGGVVILPTLRATGAVVVIGDTTLSADEYDLQPGFLRLQSYGYPSSWCGDVTVTLTHGYDSLPADLKRVALSMADQGTSPGGRLKSAGPFTYEFPEGSEDAAVIDRYRLAPRP